MLLEMKKQNKIQIVKRKENEKLKPKEGKEGRVIGEKKGNRWSSFVTTIHLLLDDLRDFGEWLMERGLNILWKSPVMLWL